jgi:hypothetical protein
MFAVNHLNGFNASVIEARTYTTWDPSNKGGSIALSNGDLSITDTVNEGANCRAIQGIASGKYYWEITVNTLGNGHYLGVSNTSLGLTTEVQTSSNGKMVRLNTGNKINGDGGGSAYGSAFIANDVCMIALDMDNGKIWWGKNGTWFNSGDPAAGTNAAFTGLSGTLYPTWSNMSSGSPAATANFGATAQTYSAPSGFNSGVYTVP